MLLVEEPREDGTAWPAFIACQARQDEEAGRGLATAFARGDWQAVRSFRLDGRPDATCWFAAAARWLSTEAA